MPALIDAIDIKRKMYFEFESTPYYCLDVELSTPTARGGQTLVRIKMRNLLTRAVFDKTFKAGEKFKEPDLETVEASYLYSDNDASYFMDQESFDTIALASSTPLVVSTTGRPATTVTFSDDPPGSRTRSTRYSLATSTTIFCRSVSLKPANCARTT